jgi:hypothetical protein
MRYCKPHFMRGSTASTMGFYLRERLDDDELFDPEKEEETPWVICNLCKHQNAPWGLPWLL